MITKNDCLLLLSEMQNSGINTTEKMKELIRIGEPTIDIIKYINDNRQLDLTKFYEKLRKSYNNKKSKLYINIVKEKVDDPKDVLVTLASLNLQILLFSKTIDNCQQFFRHARLEEINKCLLNYSKTGDIIPCQKLLKYVKADLKVCEQISKE